MTNLDIIYYEVVTEKIYTEEEAKKKLATGDLGIHTYATWKRMGYQVKKGEKAKLTTNLWRFRDEKKNDKGEVEKEAGFYLVKSHLFTKEQVERIA